MKPRQDSDAPRRATCEELYDAMEGRGLTTSLADFTTRWCGLSTNYFYPIRTAVAAGEPERIPYGGYFRLWRRLIEAGQHDLAARVFSILVEAADREPLGISATDF